MSKRCLRDDIVDFLLDGFAIKITGKIPEVYVDLIGGGYANYCNNLVWMNWKTRYLKLWRENNEDTNTVSSR